MKKVLSGEKDKKTAIHEAGHAVVALHLRRGVRDVDIIPSEDGAIGHAQVLDPTSKLLVFYKPTIVRKINDSLLIAVAGSVAEEIHLPTDKDLIVNAADRRDLDRVYQIAKTKLGNGSGILSPKKVFQRAIHILLRPTNWNAVRLIAKDLMVKRKLSGDEARALFKRAKNADIQSVSW